MRPSTLIQLFYLVVWRLNPSEKTWVKHWVHLPPIFGGDQTNKSNFPTVRLAVLIWNHFPYRCNRCNGGPFSPRISSLSSLKGSMCKDSTGTSLCFSHLGMVDGNPANAIQSGGAKWPRQKKLFGFDVDFDFRIIMLVLGIDLLELGTWSEFAHRDRMY